MSRDVPMWVPRKPLLLEGTGTGLPPSPGATGPPLLTLAGEVLGVLCQGECLPVLRAQMLTRSCGFDHFNPQGVPSIWGSTQNSCRDVGLPEGTCHPPAGRRTAAPWHRSRRACVLERQPLL